MAIDRSLWRIWFAALPHWTCPSCKNGRLKSAGEPHTIETGESLQGRNHEDWNPEWIRKRFVGLLTCDNPLCGEVCAISGDCPTRAFEDEDHDEHWYDTYTPTSFAPAPLPIALPADVPDAVERLIKSASSLLWADVEAAANKLRQAIETTLTDRRVRRQTVTSRGHRHIYKLHDRIEMFKTSMPEAGDLLSAIKWLGNVGSHVGKLTRDDVLDGFELFEHALEIIYGKDRAKVRALAKRINRRKGPVGARRGAGSRR